MAPVMPIALRLQSSDEDEPETAAAVVIRAWEAVSPEMLANVWALYSSESQYKLRSINWSLRQMN
jgi:hypothetical protein